MLSYLRKKMKVIIITVAALFAVSMLYGLGFTRWRGGEEARRGIGKVNGTEISPARFSQMLNNMTQQFGGAMRLQDFAFMQYLALEQAIDFTVILKEAKRKVRISNAEVNAVVDNIKKQQNFTSDKELDAALKRVGMDLSKFKELLKEELLVQKMVNKIRDGVKVGPEDLREVKASHILLTSEAETKTILERIKKGDDFAKLAKKYSKDPGSAIKGGDLGYFTYGRMVEPFSKAAFSLKVGEVSDIVKSNFGYHIIKVFDSRLRKIEGNEKDIEKAVLGEKQQQAYQKWYSQIRSSAKVDIFSPELKGHKYRFSNRMVEAIEEYKKAIAQNPANPYLHVFLGDAYTSFGKLNDALNEYERAVAMEGGNFDLYLILAKAYEQSKNREKALEQYRRASLIAGDNKALHEQLLKIYQDLKSSKDISYEKSEISRITKKEAFEKKLKGEPVK